MVNDIKEGDKYIYSAPVLVASTTNQLASLAELKKSKKYGIYETITEDDLSAYHKISCQPITVNAENDMELVSDILTWGERYLNNWGKGTYVCSRCKYALYSSEDKYKGPCVWPSFRNPIDNKNNKHSSSSSIATRTVYPYNKYTCTVKEVYCGNCELFIGHMFEDAKLKGDTHPNARWRH